MLFNSNSNLYVVSVRHNENDDKVYNFIYHGKTPQCGMYVICSTKYGREIGVIEDVLDKPQFMAYLKPCSPARPKDLYQAGYIFKNSDFICRYWVENDDDNYGEEEYFEKERKSFLNRIVNGLYKDHFKEILHAYYMQYKHVWQFPEEVPVE